MGTLKSGRSGKEGHEPQAGDCDWLVGKRVSGRAREGAEKRKEGAREEIRSASDGQPGRSATAEPDRKEARARSMFAADSPPEGTPFTATIESQHAERARSLPTSRPSPFASAVQFSPDSRSENRGPSPHASRHDERPATVAVRGPEEIPAERGVHDWLQKPGLGQKRIAADAERSGICQGPI